AGRPLAGVKFIAAFASGNGAAMSELEAVSDAQGRFQLRDVRLPQGYFERDPRVRMVARKSGYDGAETKELNSREVQQAGVGDFGTVTLKPGHTLRGKVVDERGRPVEGALVTNMTNYFLYDHLRCRTDAAGRFAMPDLSYGRQTISAQYGERSAHQECAFDAESGEFVIALHLLPKSGMRT